jgi:hypothetical protein
MIRHLPYFEMLSTLDESSPSWYATLGGLAVLDLVDKAREDPALVSADLASSAAISETISRIGEGNPVKRVLKRVVASVHSDDLGWQGVGVGLFEYGRALDFDGNWKLAVDVFETAADIARASHEPKAAIEATTALGGAARRSGDWDKSAEGYADAAHLASAVGDRALGLTVRVGTANTMIAKGNLPEAESLLDEVIEEAERSRLDTVTPLALHAKSTVAHLRKDFNGALALAYRALEKTTNANLRENLTAEIAAAFVELGLRDAGRDAHLILSITSRYQWVRSQATLNLMELASLDGQCEPFDRYSKQLCAQPLDPRLQAYFLLYYGQGCARLGRLEAAAKSIAEAGEFANAHKIHQVAHEANESLASLGKMTAPSSAEIWHEDVPTETREIAAAFAKLRKTAASSSRTEGWD